MKAKPSTEAKVKSQEKAIFESVGREFFQMYCDEHQVLKESMDDLLGMARDSDDKLRLDIRKFLIEQLIGKPKQGVSLDTTTGIEIIINKGVRDEEKDQS